MTRILLLFIVLLFGCTGVEQEYFYNDLRTVARYEGETVWIDYTLIDLNTSDSIKVLKYNEALKHIEKRKTIDKITND